MRQSEYLAKYSPANAAYARLYQQREVSRDTRGIVFNASRSQIYELQWGKDHGFEGWNCVLLTLEYHESAENWIVVPTAGVS